MTHETDYDPACDAWGPFVPATGKRPRTGASWPTHKARRRNARKRALKRRKEAGPVTVHTPPLPARVSALYTRTRPLEVFVAVDDPDAEPTEVRVRWRLGREQPWRCDACGPQTAAECPHTFAAGLLLSEELFGLTRLPTLQHPLTTDTDPDTEKETQS